MEALDKLSDKDYEQVGKILHLETEPEPSKVDDQETNNLTEANEQELIDENI